LYFIGSKLNTSKKYLIKKLISFRIKKIPVKTTLITYQLKDCVGKGIKSHAVKKEKISSALLLKIRGILGDVKMLHKRMIIRSEINLCRFLFSYLFST
jgi:hypothetical protein